ncbi:hypothetical protein SDC9_158862 [bioreactor metagenome]|uniref:Transposase DDE domain-containing protein n=1 Tax=bioreactor metagenome TaxID=1076179 RepID=A0A645FDX8_9ZZZZ
MDNMSYNDKDDYYLCKNNKKLTVTGTKTRKSTTGYKCEITCYMCKDCKGCQFKTKCIKGNNCKTPLEDRTKKLNISKVFNEKRKENLQRIVSTEGIQLRMNRSIQAEGAFAQIKQNMEFRRFLCKGEKNILAECILLGMAHNINKLHNKIHTGKCKTSLYPLKKSA